MPANDEGTVAPVVIVEGSVSPLEPTVGTYSMTQLLSYKATVLSPQESKLERSRKKLVMRRRERERDESSCERKSALSSDSKSLVQSTMNRRKRLR